MKKAFLLLLLSVFAFASSGILVDPNYFCSPAQMTGTSAFDSGLSENQNWIPASGSLVSPKLVKPFYFKESYFGNGGAFPRITVDGLFENPRVVVRFSGKDKWFYSNLLSATQKGSSVLITSTDSRNVFEPNDFGLLFDKLILTSNSKVLTNVIIPFTNNRKIVYLALNDLNTLPSGFLGDLDKHFYDPGNKMDFSFTGLFFNSDDANKVSSNTISLIKLICDDAVLVNARASNQLLPSDLMRNLVVQYLPFVDTKWMYKQSTLPLLAVKSASFYPKSATSFKNKSPWFIKTGLTPAFLYDYLMHPRYLRKGKNKRPTYSEVVAKYEQLKIEVTKFSSSSEGTAKIAFTYLPVVPSFMNGVPSFSLFSNNFLVNNKVRRYSTAEISLPLYAFSLASNPESNTPEYLYAVTTKTARLTEINQAITLIQSQLLDGTLDGSKKKDLNRQLNDLISNKVKLENVLFNLRRSSFPGVSMSINALGSFESVSPKEEITNYNYKESNPDRFVYGVTASLNLNPHYVNPLDYNAFTMQVYGGVVSLTPASPSIIPSYGVLFGGQIYFDNLNFNARLLYNPDLSYVVQRRELDISASYNSRFKVSGLPLLLYADYSRFNTKNEIPNNDDSVSLQRTSTGVGVKFGGFSLFLGPTYLNPGKTTVPTIKFDYVNPNVLGGTLGVTSSTSVVGSNLVGSIGLQFSPTTPVYEQEIRTTYEETSTTQTTSASLIPQTRMLVKSFDDAGKNLHFSDSNDFNDKTKGLTDLHLPFDYEYFTTNFDNTMSVVSGSGITGSYTNDNVPVGSLAYATITYEGKPYDTLPLIPGSTAGKFSGVLSSDESKNIFYHLFNSKAITGNCIVPVRLFVKTDLKQPSIKKEQLFFIYDKTKSMKDEISKVSDTLVNLVRNNKFEDNYDISIISLEEDVSQPSTHAINQLKLYSFTSYSKNGKPEESWQAYSQLGTKGYPEDYYSAVKLALSKTNNGGRIIILGDALPRGGVNEYNVDYSLPDEISDKQVTFFSDGDLGYANSFNSVKSNEVLTTQRIIDSLNLNKVKLDFINFPHEDSSPDLVSDFWKDFTKKVGGTYYSHSNFQSDNDFQQVFGSTLPIIEFYTPELSLNVQFSKPTSDAVDAGFPLSFPSRKVYDSSSIGLIELSVKTTSTSDNTLEIHSTVKGNGKSLSPIRIPFTGSKDCSRTFNGVGDKEPLTSEILISNEDLIRKTSLISR